MTFAATFTAIVMDGQVLVIAPGWWDQFPAADIDRRAAGYARNAAKWPGYEGAAQALMKAQQEERT